VPGAGQAAAARAASARARERDAGVLDILRPLSSQGLTLAAMAAALNERGVPTPRGGRWTPTSVKRVLDRAARPDQPAQGRPGLD
jgi:hypothetical protein